ncbi:hypothetical protein [Salinisphaera orenii]|uniref:hypothetical protein n=1 Tax=Salinisphaera orenii TaxID=856731 RepID=UPI001FE5DB65|nr:hypothetical protein [Salinisphaera orenii]
MIKIAPHFARGCVRPSFFDLRHAVSAFVQTCHNGGKRQRPDEATVVGYLPCGIRKPKRCDDQAKDVLFEINRAFQQTPPIPQLEIVSFALMPNGENSHRRIIGDFEQGDMACTAEADDQFPQERRVFGRLAAREGEIGEQRPNALRIAARAPAPATGSRLSRKSYRRVRSSRAWRVKTTR